MAYIQCDILLRTFVQFALDDLRKNDFLLDDISAGFSPYDISSIEYGDKERKRFKDWFLSNEIGVYMQNQQDIPTFPCIVIVDEGSSEMENRDALGDEKGADEDFDVKSVESTPDYVYPPFTPAGYNAATGTVTMPAPMTTDAMFAGMFLVSQRSGKAYQVIKVLTSNTFEIAKDATADFTKCYVTPAYALWSAHRNITFLRQSFSLVVMAASEQVYCNWLHAIMMYSLIRYKEVFLEGRGFELSTFSTSALMRAPRFEPEMVWFRNISISGQCELNVIQYIAPKLAGVKGRIKIADGPTTPEGYLEQVQQQTWSMMDDPPVPVTGVIRGPL